MSILSYHSSVITSPEPSPEPSPSTFSHLLTSVLNENRPWNFCTFLVTHSVPSIQPHPSDFGLQRSPETWHYSDVKSPLWLGVIFFCNLKSIKDIKKYSLTFWHGGSFGNVLIALVYPMRVITYGWVFFILMLWLWCCDRNRPGSKAKWRQLMRVNAKVVFSWNRTTKLLRLASAISGINKVAMFEYVWRLTFLENGGVTSSWSEIISAGFQAAIIHIITIITRLAWLISLTIVISETKWNNFRSIFAKLE